MSHEIKKSSLQNAVDLVDVFFKGNQRTAISSIEKAVIGVEGGGIQEFISSCDINSDLLRAAADIKRAASQINVTIHALGILRALPHILERDEKVQDVSLGAGNTGHPFDLTTTHRIAEFKFINWRGGAEAIRQNGIFKDFFNLESFKTEKKKCLYLLGVEHALNFFNGRRSLRSVLEKDEATHTRFLRKHGESYSLVRDYYRAHAESVQIIDLSQQLPELAQFEDDAEQPDR